MNLIRPIPLLKMESLLVVTHFAITAHDEPFLRLMDRFGLELERQMRGWN